MDQNVKEQINTKFDEIVNQEDGYIIFAALAAMTIDFHGFQDNLTKAEWKRSTEIFDIVFSTLSSLDVLDEAVVSKKK